MLKLRVHPARVEQPLRVQLRLELPVIAQQRRGQRLEWRFADAMAETGGVAAEFTGSRLNVVSRGFQPALRAAPVDQLLTGQVQRPEVVG